jgi:hypothetical protein
MREFECVSMLLVRLWAMTGADGVSVSLNEPSAFLLAEWGAGDVGEVCEEGEVRDVGDLDLEFALILVCGTSAAGLL